MFKEITNRVDKAKTKATYRAMNRAVSTANTQFKRAMSKETGLKNKVISNRFKVKKASTKSLSAYVSFGTKIGISLSEFKPKIKKIKKNKRTYQGVTVKIGSERVQPQNSVGNKGFLITAKSGKSLVLARKGTSRTPVEALKHNLYSAAKDNQKDLNSKFNKNFREQFSKQLKYELGKK